MTVSYGIYCGDEIIKIKIEQEEFKVASLEELESLLKDLIALEKKWGYGRKNEN